MLNQKTIEQEIQNLLLQYPELSDDEQLRADMLEGATSAHDYLRFLVKRVGETEGYYAGTKSYVGTLQDRMDRLKSTVGMYRALIRRLMEKADLSKVQLDIATLNMQPSGRKVVITDEDLLPEDCLRKFTEPNKTIIGDRLKAGETVPGAELSNAEPHLVIKTR
jgi:Siphovirus Gp157